MFDFLAAELKHGESLSLCLFFLSLSLFGNLFIIIVSVQLWLFIYFFFPKTRSLCCDSDVAGSLSTFSQCQCTRYQPASHGAAEAPSSREISVLLRFIFADRTSTGLNFIKSYMLTLWSTTCGHLNINTPKFVFVSFSAAVTGRPLTCGPVEDFVAAARQRGSFPGCWGQMAPRPRPSGSILPQNSPLAIQHLQLSFSMSCHAVTRSHQQVAELNHWWRGCRSFF